ncbi:MAG: hypothetical protein H6668_04285 [Ardenticatenaceae bacterium]|nr:hypothetical protein [Ardenticatenaceae bacterium]
MNTFAQLFAHYLTRSGYSASQLARLTNIPKMTLLHWQQGQVKRPRSWQDLLRVSHTLHLTKNELNLLLHEAGHPPVAELAANNPTPKDRELLTKWLQQSSHPPHSPFQVIPDLPTFAGRQPELAQLESWLCANHHPTVYCLSGMGGVGKTVLAARLAYRLRPHFPDGVLWARLEAGSSPMPILRLFAAAYGEDVREYEDVDSRSQAVRMVLADKRVLMVLDNVNDSQQAQPLLPPTGPGAVLLTTRRRNLLLAEGAHHLHLEPFTLEESLALLTRLLGSDRAAQEEKVLTAVSHILHHLPLSLAIVGRRLATDPTQSAADWLHQLQQHPLDALADESQSVRATLALSFATLPATHQHFFMALSQLSHTFFTPEMAAAHAGLSDDDTRRYLCDLYNLSLVHCGGHNTYRLIPLLAQFAQELHHPT